MFKAGIWCTVKPLGVMSTSSKSHPSSPHASVGRGLCCPTLLFHQGEIPSLLTDFLGVHCPHVIWKLHNHNGWSRVAEELLLFRVQSGFCRPPRLWAQTQRSSSQHLPKIPTPCPGKRYHCCSSPQPYSQMLAGSNPWGQSSVPQPALPSAWLPK